LANQEDPSPQVDVSRDEMIWWVCDHMKLDMIRNEGIREEIGVTSIEDRMRRTRLRCFGHIKKRSMDAPVRRCEMISLPECIRGRGRPNKSWNK